jgi:hypothetical protein
MEAVFDILDARQCAPLVTSSFRLAGGHETACYGNGHTAHASIREGNRYRPAEILSGTRLLEGVRCMAYPGNGPMGRATSLVHILQPRSRVLLQSTTPQ